MLVQPPWSACPSRGTLGEYCWGKRSSRPSRRAEVASRLHTCAPAGAEHRPDGDRATPGPLLPATAASKPSWPIPSTQSFCILSPVFHRLEHASDPGSLARRSPHALVDNALLLDHANRRPFAHPNPRHALLLGLDTHRSRGSRRSQSVPLVCATLQTSLPDRSEERRVGKECRSRWSPYH